MEQEKLYTIAEVSEILKVSSKTVLKLTKDKELVGLRINSSFRVTVDSLNKYLNKKIEEETKRTY
ncbi:MAG: helix-turn-helix domain-containing protein [Candidatus Izemoplasmatales bacterium]|nr:helix-turn-helix domain-containing protein [Candidatus Izemoplasmatales bacterium]